MEMTISEKVRLMLARRSKTVTALAKEMNVSRQYMTRKLKENNFTVYELKKIAAWLQYDFEAVFISKDGKERI